MLMAESEPRWLVQVSGRHRLSEDALVRCINALPGIQAQAYGRSAAREDCEPDIVLVEADSETCAAAISADIQSHFPRARVVFAGASASRHFPLPTSTLDPEANMSHAAELLGALLFGRQSATATGAARNTPSRWSATEGSLSKLTARQIDVMRLLAGGRRPDEIAHALSISPQTVRTHLQNIMTTLGVHCRLEIVAAARRSGMLDEPRYAAAT